jgi:hypothetical protein
MKVLPPSPALRRTDLRFAVGALLAIGFVVAFVASVHVF